MTLADLKDAGQVFALAAAGVFFSVKVVAGYLIVNLSTALRLERARGSNGTDLPVAKLALAKGDRSTLLLHDVSGRVWIGGEFLEMASGVSVPTG